ncbi:MAG: hypothetical protein OEV76_04215 [Anaerolineae bacterium]|nr:hypothetical protein [Anaerolineae bacterium]
MPGHNPFDMDFDGDVDGIDFLGFDYLVRHVLGYGSEEEQAEEDDETNSSPNDHRWDDEDEWEDDYR